MDNNRSYNLHWVIFIRRHIYIKQQCLMLLMLHYRYWLNIKHTNIVTLNVHASSQTLDVKFFLNLVLSIGLRLTTVSIILVSWPLIK